jgi:hypothetical protein
MALVPDFDRDLSAIALRCSTVNSVASSKELYMQRLLTRRELLTAELFLSTCTAHGTPTLLGVLSVLHASANHEAGGTHGPGLSSGTGERLDMSSPPPPHLPELFK